MNKFKLALMIGLVGSSLVNASQRNVDNDTEWDGYYNSGLNTKGQELNAQSDESSWLPRWLQQKKQALQDWYYTPSALEQNESVQDMQNEDVNDVEPVAPVVIESPKRLVEQEVVAPVATSKVIDDIKRKRLSNATEELSKLNDRAVMTDKNMHRFTFGALVALQNSDIREAIIVLNAGLDFINNKVQDGYDIADYQRYVVAFNDMLNRLNYVLNR